MMGTRRRARQLVWAVLALAPAAACDHSPTASSHAPASMLLGADISALATIEQAGGVFRDGGQAKDAIAILRSRGANIYRLRLFVNPNDSDVQVNDLPYTIQLAGRIKASGAKLLLDIHYSDTWADPGHQTTPAAWAGLGFAALAQKLETYTDSVVTQLKQAGALPDIVQVGNEIDSGMLWPVGQLYVAGGDTLAEWTQFTGLLKAGIKGVRDALAPGDTVRIMLHYGQGGGTASTQWFFDHMAAYGVPYDVIGLSYYPFWHGPLLALQGNLQATAARYGKDIVVVETSYPWRAGGWESLVTTQVGMAWPASPAGQAQFARDLVDAVASTPGSHGAGVVWWYPEAIQVPGLLIWGAGSLALFDSTGNVLPAATQLGTP
ncbi:MAG: glycosyl hydrolase 53 family protein [Gemmatimonadales bacterium]